MWKKISKNLLIERIDGKVIFKVEIDQDYFNNELIEKINKKFNKNIEYKTDGYYEYNNNGPYFSADEINQINSTDYNNICESLDEKLKKIHNTQFHFDNYVGYNANFLENHIYFKLNINNEFEADILGYVDLTDMNFGENTKFSEINYLNKIKNDLYEKIGIENEVVNISNEDNETKNEVFEEDSKLTEENNPGVEEETDAETGKDNNEENVETSKDNKEKNNNRIVITPNDQIENFALDIVFVIDTTGSMNPIIDCIKGNILNFSNGLKEKLSNRYISLEELRVKVIKYKNYYFDHHENAFGESDFYKLPDSENQLKQYMDNNISAKGGSDEYPNETSLEALYNAINQTFTVKGDKRRHIIVLFTDTGATEMYGKTLHNNNNYKNMISVLNPIGYSENVIENMFKRDYPDNMPVSNEDFYVKCMDKMINNPNLRIVIFAPSSKHPWNTIEGKVDNCILQNVNPGDGGKEINMKIIYELISGSI